MKYCEEYAALLDLYLDDELDADGAANVRAHLETCPGCRAYIEDIRAIREAFPSEEDVTLPEGFAEGVMAAVRSESAKQAHRSRRRTRFLVPLAACCAVVLLALPIRTLLTGTVPGPSSRSMAEEAAAASYTVQEEALPTVSGPVFAAIGLPAAWAEALPAESTPAADEHGDLCYVLSPSDYDALLSALEDGIGETLCAAPELREEPGACALVYLTEN